MLSQKTPKIITFAVNLTSRAMLNTFLRGIYCRIRISKYFSGLTTLNQLYLKAHNDEYLLQIESFFSDLLHLPFTFTKSEPNTGSNSDLIRFFSETQDNPLYTIYHNHVDLLVKMANDIDNRNVAELYNLSDQVGQFLDRVYNTAFPPKKIAIITRYSVAGLGATIFYIPADIILLSFSKNQYQENGRKCGIWT